MRRVVLCTLLLLGCTAKNLPVCAAGAQIACACPGGGMGAQRCASDGSGWGECAGCQSAAMDSAVLLDSAVAPVDSMIATDLVMSSADLTAVHVDASAIPDGSMTIVDLAVVADRSVTPDLAMPDLAVPDLAMPDLASPQCVNDSQCTTLPHAHGTCTSKLTCAVAYCDLNFADCDGIAANGCESNSLTDPANCNFCGVNCQSVLNGVGVCQSGACAIGSCNGGFANCDGKVTSGCAVATSSDLQNCGACGNICALPSAVTTCSSGQCKLVNCRAGFADCDGTSSNGCEVDVQIDPSNCGVCGTVCPSATPDCTAGACTVEDFPEPYIIYEAESP